MAFVRNITLMRLIHKETLWGAGPQVIWAPNNCKKVTKLQQCTCHHIKLFTDEYHKNSIKAYRTLQPLLPLLLHNLGMSVYLCCLSTSKQTGRGALCLRSPTSALKLAPHARTAHEPIQNGRFQCGHKRTTLHTKVALWHVVTKSWDKNEKSQFSMSRDQLWSSQKRQNMEARRRRARMLHWCDSDRTMRHPTKMSMDPSSRIILDMATFLKYLTSCAKLYLFKTVLMSNNKSTPDTRLNYFIALRNG